MQADIESSAPARLPELPRSGEGARNLDRRALEARIERVALELFLQSGYDATTVDEIARAAGISRRTFFRYYESKFDVFDAGGRRRYLGVIEEMERRPRFEPTFTAVCESFRANAKFTPEELDELKLANQVVLANPPLEKRVRELGEPLIARLIQLAAERLGTDPVEDPTADVLVRVVRAAAQSAQRAWQASGFEPDLRDLMLARFAMIEGAQVCKVAAALERQQAREALG